MLFKSDLADRTSKPMILDPYSVGRFLEVVNYLYPALCNPVKGYKQTIYGFVYMI